MVAELISALSEIIKRFVVSEREIIPEFFEKISPLARGIEIWRGEEGGEMNTETKIYKNASISKNLADGKLAKEEISRDEYKDTITEIDSMLEAELDYLCQHSDGDEGADNNL